MIHTGWNILRFIRAFKNPDATIGGVACTLYKFQAINIAYEEIEFQYVVPLGRQRGTIIKDLEVLIRTKNWIDVNLIEKQGVMLISNMRDTKQPQQEIKLKGR